MLSKNQRKALGRPTSGTTQDLDDSARSVGGEEVAAFRGPHKTGQAGVLHVEGSVIATYIFQGRQEVAPAKWEDRWLIDYLHELNKED